jgi:hypothetical protein
MYPGVNLRGSGLIESTVMWSNAIDDELARLRQELRAQNQHSCSLSIEAPSNLEHRQSEDRGAHPTIEELELAPL